MNSYLRGIALSILFILFYKNTYSQSVPDSLCVASSCMCHSDRSPAGIMFGHIHSKNEWMITYRFMNNFMNRIQKESAIIDKKEVYKTYQMAPESMSMNMHMFMGMYGLTSKLTGMLMFNYAIMDMNMTMQTLIPHAGHTHLYESKHNMHSSGISDITLLALYEILSKNEHQLNINAGLNIPTGSTSVKGTVSDYMYCNKTLPYAMQLGSGTFDVQTGLNYFYENHKTSYCIQANTVIRTGKNKMGYKLGNSLSINNWIAYQCLSWLSTSFRSEINISSKMQTINSSLDNFTEPSANSSNYGSRLINAHIGAVLQSDQPYLNQYKFAIEYGIPVYQRLNGIQMRTQHIISASFSFMY